MTLRMTAGQRVRQLGPQRLRTVAGAVGYLRRLFGSALLGEYRCDAGASATTDDVQDYSGSGNTGTRGGGIGSGFKPAWAADGLSFDGGDLFSLPPAVGGQAATVLYALDVAPAAGYQSLLYTSGGNTYLDTDGMPGERGNPYTARVMPSERQQGPLILEEVWGSPGAWYYGGSAPLAYYAQENRSRSSTAGGTTWFGFWQGVGSSGFIGKLYYMLLINRAITSDERTAAVAYLTAQLAARGVTVGNTLAATRTRILCWGDSLTGGQGATVPGDYPYRLRLALTDPVSITKLGYGGRRIEQMVSLYASTLSPVVAAHAGAGAAVYVVMGSCINDINNSRTTAQILADVDTLIAAIVADGGKVVLLTPLASISTDNNAGYETVRQEVSDGYVARVGANVKTFDFRGGVLGDEDDDLNTTYFNADRVHLTNAGYTVYAAGAETALGGFGVT
jgi:lysophospholipase L1-like esterase